MKCWHCWNFSSFNLYFWGKNCSWGIHTFLLLLLFFSKRWNIYVLPICNISWLVRVNFTIFYKYLLEKRNEPRCSFSFQWFFLLSAKTCTKAIPKSFWTCCCFQVQCWQVSYLQGRLWVPLGSHNWFFQHKVYRMFILSLLGNWRRMVKFRFAF